MQPTAIMSLAQKMASTGTRPAISSRAASAPLASLIIAGDDHRVALAGGFG